MVTALLILALLFFLTCSALASSAEIALFSLPAVTVKAYQRGNHPTHQLIAELALKPRELFVTLFVLNIACNILLQNTASTLFGAAASWWLKVGVPFVLIVLFGELLPKYVALRNNVPIAFTLAPLVHLFSRLLKPIQKYIMLIAVPVSRTLFSFLRKDEPVSREELRHVLRTSLEFGVLHADEVNLVSGYLDLQDRQVRELMWPREDILYYDSEKPLSKLLHLFIEKECSRIPVCEGTIQNVKGVITATKFFLYRDRIKEPEDLMRYLDKPFFVPETTPVRKLMGQFNERHEEVALAVDEYGSIVGLIAHEDLIEVVVGEITDQRDENPLYTRAGNATIIASGKLELSELEALFGVTFESPNNQVTLGGWLTERLGDIPKSGTKYQTEDFLFQVLAAGPNRVKRVYVRRLSTPKTKN